MKKVKISFTRGEWTAAVVLLLLTVLSYLFYFLYDTYRKPCVDFAEVEAEFVAFQEEQEQLQRLMDAQRQSKNFYKNHFYRDSLPKKTKRPMYDIVKIDLNHCDSTDIVVVPQFGSKRAAKLVEYRDKLGGFYDLSQLKEVYVLQNLELEFLQQYFYVRKSDVKKININTATYKELIAHPYFDAYLTKTILNYRSKKKTINSFEELQSVTHAYPELMAKLKYYVVFSDEE